jgi:DUF971 family protein
MTPTDPRSVKPRNLAVAGRSLAIAWGDGHESFFPFDELRRDCPCATCRARRSAPAEEGPLRVLRAPRAGDVSIGSLVPVGAYAVQIVWSDGHDTGIYAFDALRAACPCGECRAGG